ncbi:hypothetical protein QC763_607150 [Podospora pseudopauciseta]|uniref:BHLH domain-containing protein n=1 Tax=Podospora pseudopauciseta TaxID=2093780 RepID=A0ABR0H5V8_9PEZI|nr:hypothetical protein QC763_607150 [Podospora pseudopauciseta]
MEPSATKTSIMIKEASSGADETSVSAVPTPGYGYMGQASYGANLVPWSLPDAPYTASSFFEEPPCDFFSLSRTPFTPFVGGNWHLSNNLSPETSLPTPLSSVGSRAGVWRGEPGGEYCEHELFSPVSELATIDMADSVTHTKRSWSEESSTSAKHQPNDKIKATSRSKGRGKHNIQLRTASRKARKGSLAPATPLSPAESVHNPGSASDDDDLTPEERRARRNHNLVEKQYRNRLNAQFERLLAVLPLEQYKGGHLGQGESCDGFATDEKRMSKAEVLDLATRRIKALEMEKERLNRERKELLRNMDIMAGAVAQAANQGL